MVQFVPFVLVLNPVSVIFSCIALLNRCKKPKESALDIDDLEQPILRFPDLYESISK